MTLQDMMMVRIYLTEGKQPLDQMLALLRDREHIRGVTVFRGIAGFGTSGHIHTTTLTDLSLRLPVVVEFFDTPERVEETLSHISTIIKPGHIVTWPVKVEFH